MARLSGRPIYPCALVTSRKLTVQNWDRTTIGLPFGEAVLAIGEPVRVPRDADEAAMEAARRAVQAGLDEVHGRAYALLGKQDPGAELRDAKRRRAA